MGSMQDIIVYESEDGWNKSMEELDYPVVIPQTSTIIDYENSLYQELDKLQIVARLAHIKQLGLANRCKNTMFADHTRYSHSLIFATKLDHIAQTFGLDRKLGVTTAMFHDAASTPLSDSVSKAMDIDEEKYLGKVLTKYDEVQNFLNSHSISKTDIIKLVQRKDDSPLGQLINSKDSIDIDRWSYIIGDAWQLDRHPNVWNNRFVVDPFRFVNIYDNQIVFEDVETVRLFLEARTQMFEKIYRNSQLMAKEAFMPQLTKQLLELGVITTDSVLEITDMEFEAIALKSGGELGKRILDMDGFEEYGSIDAGEKEICDYLTKSTDRPFAVKQLKPMNIAVGTPILTGGEIRPYSELEPKRAEFLRCRASAWNHVVVYGYENDPGLEQITKELKREFGVPKQEFPKLDKLTPF